MAIDEVTKIIEENDAHTVSAMSPYGLDVLRDHLHSAICRRHRDRLETPIVWPQRYCLHRAGRRELRHLPALEGVRTCLGVIVAVKPHDDPTAIERDWGGLRSGGNSAKEPPSSGYYRRLHRMAGDLGHEHLRVERSPG
jgi:hypothetical protein